MTNKGIITFLCFILTCSIFAAEPIRDNNKMAPKTIMQEPKHEQVDSPNLQKAYEYRKKHFEQLRKQKKKK